MPGVAFQPADPVLAGRDLTLLRAATGAPGAALKAWEQAVQGAGETRLAEEAPILMPSVYRNLSSIGAQAVSARLKGLYRYTWGRNQLVLHGLALDVQALGSRGVEARLGGDASMVCAYYGDAGARAIYRQSIEVGDLTSAVTTLARTRWRQVSGGPGWAKLRNPNGSSGPSLW
ncbi:MAG: hypothetical protein ACRDIU_11195, partial [Actinomycetota bacterium]